MGKKKQDKMDAQRPEFITGVISGHPYERQRHRLDDYNVNSSAEIGDMEDRGFATASGLVSGIRPLHTKGGKDMAFITLEDDMGTTQVIVFPTCFAKCGHLLVMDELIVVRGKIQRKFRGAGREMVTDAIIQVGGGDNFEDPITSEKAGLKRPARIPAILPNPDDRWTRCSAASPR